MLPGVGEISFEWSTPVAQAGILVVAILLVLLGLAGRLCLKWVASRIGARSWMAWLTSWWTGAPCSVKTHPLAVGSAAVQPYWLLIGHALGRCSRLRKLFFAPLNASMALSVRGPCVGQSPVPVFVFLVLGSRLIVLCVRILPRAPVAFTCVGASHDSAQSTISDAI